MDNQNNAVAQHTPGPWHVANGVQIRSDKDQIAKVWMMRRGEGQANARLIAAAPELLEALESAIRQYSGVLILAETGRYATDEMIEKVIDMCTPDSPFGQLVAVAKKARGAQ